MDAGKRQISFYFNGQDYLEIPFFQRAYVWNEELLKRFLRIKQSNELFFFMSSLILQLLVESRKNYFIKIICSYHKKAVPLRFK